MTAQRGAPQHSRRGNRTSVGIVMALLLGLPLILAACEAPGIPHPQAVLGENPTPAAPSPTPLPASENQENPGPEPLQGNPQISLKDFRLEPDELVVKAGTVTFVLKNEGRFTHDFRVEGRGIDKKAPKVGRGRSREWEITLPPGTYRISCPISNHADRGMVGTLTVVD